MALIHFLEMDRGRISFERARHKSGLGPFAAVISAAVRLLLWHYMQPLMYAVAFFVYFDRIDTLQQRLGYAVLAREIYYLVQATAVVFYHPAYLLVSMPATLRDDIQMSPLKYFYFRGSFGAFMYVIMPEKAVGAALATGVASLGYEGRGIPQCTSFLLYIIGAATFLLDLCGIAALLAAVFSGNMPLPLMAGYSLTAAAPIGAVVAYAVYFDPVRQSFCIQGYCGLMGRGLALLRSAILITLYLLLTWGIFVDGVVTTTGYTILGIAGLVVLGLIVWLFCAKGPDGHRLSPPYLSHTVDGFMRMKAVDNDTPAALKEELLGHLGSAIRLARDT